MKTSQISYKLIKFSQILTNKVEMGFKEKTYHIIMSLKRIRSMLITIQRKVN